jgi:hypothetical protein
VADKVEFLTPPSDQHYRLMKSEKQKVPIFGPWLKFLRAHPSSKSWERHWFKILAQLKLNMAQVKVCEAQSWQNRVI